MSGKVKVWGNVVTVEWADPIEDPDPEVMAKVMHMPRGHLYCGVECMYKPSAVAFVTFSAKKALVFLFTRSRCCL